MDESRRLAGSNFDQAIDIVRRFKSKEVYVYAMGQEPWLCYIMSIMHTEQSRPISQSNRLIKECSEHGIRAERLFGEKEILICPDPSNPWFLLLLLNRKMLGWHGNSQRTW